MKFLTRNASREWAVANGLNPDWTDARQNLAIAPFKTAQVDLELGSYTPILLARQMMEWFPEDEYLLWITEWGVWPSSEDQYLFYRLRASYGEEERLKEVPGHLFSAMERDDLTTYLSLVLTFGWDAILVAKSPAFPRIFISHDEYMTLQGRTKRPLDISRKAKG